MKLTPGRMAHVKVGKGCVEALLVRKCGDCPSQEWEAFAVRTGVDYPTVGAIIQPEPIVHEPYGCMREIVMLPAREPDPVGYASFGAVPEPPGYDSSREARTWWGYACRPCGAESGAVFDARDGARLRGKDNHGRCEKDGSILLYQRDRQGAALSDPAESTPERVRPVDGFVDNGFGPPPKLGFACSCGDSKGVAFANLRRVREAAQAHIDAMKLAGDRRPHLVSYGPEAMV
jgi:hypothetical protein